MKLLMIGADTGAVQGMRGPFWNTLKGFHLFWDRVDVICPYVENPVTPVLFGNVHFHPLPKGRVLSSFSVFKQGLKISKEHKPDLISISAFGMQMMSWGGWRLAQALRRAFVVEIHHIEGVPRSAEWRDQFRYWLSYLFVHAVRRQAAGFRVVNSKELVPALVRWGVPAEKIRVVNSIYLDRKIFQPMAGQKKIYDVIFVGRLVPNKGIPLVIAAFQLLQRRIPGIKLCIVGTGPLETWLQKKLAGVDGITHIRFLRSPEEVAIAYNRAKVVVCASYAEGGPRYVVEAMACGLPAVSTPVGLMKEIVRDGETGFLLREWSAEEMAEKVYQLLTNPALYQQCSRAALAVTSQFDFDDAIAAYAGALQNFVKP